MIRVLAMSAAAALLTGCPTESPSYPYCQAYIACYEATGGTPGALDSTYGPMGRCWQTTTLAATACINACDTNLAVLKNANPDAGC